MGGGIVHSLLAATPREATWLVAITLGVFLVGTAIVIGLVARLRRLNDQVSRQMDAMLHAMTVMEDAVEALEEAVTLRVGHPDHGRRS